MQLCSVRRAIASLTSDAERHRRATSGWSASTSRSASCCCCGRRCRRCGSRRADRRRWRLVLVFTLGTVAHALRRLRVQRLGRPPLRRARQAHGRSARSRAARSRRGRRWPSPPASRSLGSSSSSSPPIAPTVLLLVRGACHRHRLSVLQALLRAAAGVPRHRVLVRHSDGLRGGAGLRVGVRLVALRVINLFWVVAYDTEYAMVDRDDDIRIGMRTSAHHVRPLRRARGRRLLRSLFRGHGVGRRCACSMGVAVLDRPRARARDRASITSAAHPHARPHALLSRVPHNHWLGSRGVRRFAVGLRMALQRVAALAVGRLEPRLLAALPARPSPPRVAALPAPERVSFLRSTGCNGAPVTIKALYFRPPASAARQAGAAGHRRARLRRHVQRARRSPRPAQRALDRVDGELLADGYAVLWPDSFNSRGRRSVCLAQARRAVHHARDAAARHPGRARVSPRRYPASTASASRSSAGRTAAARRSPRSTARIRAVAKFFAAPVRRLPLRAAVAFYPGCVVSLRAGENGCRRCRCASIPASSTTGRRPPPCVASRRGGARTRRGDEGHRVSRTRIMDSTRRGASSRCLERRDDRRQSGQGRDVGPDPGGARRRRRRGARVLARTLAAEPQ